MNLRFFQKAKILALRSDHPKHRLGAVVVDKRGHIIGQGYNVMKTHPKSNSYERRIHAEFAAILACNASTEGCTIYVYRGMKNGSMACSKPCQYCLKMLKQYGIKDIYYTNQDGYGKLSL
jgi:deoxycytidylate deaminase